MTLSHAIALPTDVANLLGILIYRKERIIELEGKKRRNGYRLDSNENLALKLLPKYIFELYECIIERHPHYKEDALMILKELDHFHNK